MSTLELPFLLFLARLNNWYWRVPVSKCITLGTTPSWVALFGDCFVNLLEHTVTIRFYFGADIWWNLVVVSRSGTLISLSTQYEQEPLYFHISNVSHWHGLIATHCTNAVPPAAYASLRDRLLTLHIQVTLFAQYHFDAGQLFHNLGHFQQFRRRLIKPAAIHTQRCSQNLVKPAPPL